MVSKNNKEVSSESEEEIEMESDDSEQEVGVESNDENVEAEVNSDSNDEAAEDEDDVNEDGENEVDADDVEQENDGDNESEEDVNSDDGDDNNGLSNAGWVDSINKIIHTNKPKGKKSLVLSKAKKLNEVKPKPKLVGFEVETKDGEVKKETLESDSDEENKSAKLPKRKKREYPSVRVKPDILQKDRERTLSKIATKGVVQLFNSVRSQQKDIDKKLKEAGPLEIKRDKVLKNIDRRAFLDKLGEEKSEQVEAKLAEKDKMNNSKNLEKPKWDVLREDFMMDAKLKDWDKQLEDEDENEPLEMECD